jgi:hypothetical protein
MAGKANAVLPAFAFLRGCDERDGDAVKRGGNSRTVSVEHVVAGFSPRFNPLETNAG